MKGLLNRAKKAAEDMKKAAEKAVEKGVEAGKNIDVKDLADKTLDVAKDMGAGAVKGTKQAIDKAGEFADKASQSTKGAAKKAGEVADKSLNPEGQKTTGSTILDIIAPPGYDTDKKPVTKGSTPKKPNAPKK